MEIGCNCTNDIAGRYQLQNHIASNPMLMCYRTPNGWLILSVPDPSFPSPLPSLSLSRPPKNETADCIQRHRILSTFDLPEKGKSIY